MIVGECVDCLDQHRVRACFDVDVAERAYCDSATGIKSMDESLWGWAVEELFLHIPEELWGNRFQLECCLVGSSSAAFMRLAMLSLNTFGNQLAASWQWLTGRSTDLCQNLTTTVPCDDVP